MSKGEKTPATGGIDELLDRLTKVDQTWREEKIGVQGEEGEQVVLTVRWKPIINAIRSQDITNQAYRLSTTGSGKAMVKLQVGQALEFNTLVAMLNLYECVEIRDGKEWAKLTLPRAFKLLQIGGPALTAILQKMLTNSMPSEEDTDALEDTNPFTGSEAEQMANALGMSLSALQDSCKSMSGGSTSLEAPLPDGITVGSAIAPPSV